jgi:TIR domain
VRIFISHSSEERWIVEQIAARLEQCRADPFCYENDMQVGAAIDETIWDQINSCDDLVVLLSPAALGSRWVSMEIGAARAHKKKLRIFRLYLTPEQVPVELTGGRATSHLNDIEKYFQEVFINSKVNVVKTLTVDDAPTDELPRTELGKYDQPESDVDELEVLRVAWEAATAAIKARRTAR